MTVGSNLRFLRKSRSMEQNANGRLAVLDPDRHYLIVKYAMLAPCCSFKGSLVRPKVVRSVHYCPATKKTMERKYTDLTSLDAFPSSSVYPTKVT